MSGFRGFVILGTMRTGSNFLEASLSEFSSLSCYGEVFNPSFIGKLNQSEWLGYNLERRESDPIGLLNAMIKASEGLPGFRLFNGHDLRVLDAVLKDASIAKIILTRDLAECYLSLRHAQVTGQWKAGDLPRIKSADVTIDRQAFALWRADITAYYALISHRLRATGQTPFTIDYRELHDVELLNGIAAFLGLSERIDRVSIATKKQIARLPQDIIVNWAEVADLFGPDASLPQWHRVAGPGVTRYMAAEGLPLLYLPVRAGTSQDMKAWFAALGQPVSFSQKSLKDWRQTTKNARSFSIVRHPADRLIALYFSDLRDDRKETRARRYKVRFGPDPSEDDLLTFARVVRAASSAQTSFRPPPDWAPQADNLRDLAQMAAPDHILRDETLPTDLPVLCETLGIKAPKLAPAEDLSRWRSKALDAEARALWGKDFLNFGYAALSR